MTLDLDLQTVVLIVAPVVSSVSAAVGVYLGIRRDLDRTAVRVDMLERQVFGEPQPVPVPTPQRRFSDRTFG